MGERMIPDGSNQREQHIHMEWEQYPTSSQRAVRLNHRLSGTAEYQINSILFLVFIKFVFVLEEFVIGKFQLSQELLG